MTRKCIHLPYWEMFTGSDWVVQSASMTNRVKTSRFLLSRLAYSYQNRGGWPSLLIFCHNFPIHLKVALTPVLFGHGFTFRFFIFRASIKFVLEMLRAMPLYFFVSWLLDYCLILLPFLALTQKWKPCNNSKILLSSHIVKVITWVQQTDQIYSLYLDSLMIVQALPDTDPVFILKWTFWVICP